MYILYKYISLNIKIFFYYSKIVFNITKQSVKKNLIAKVYI